MNTQTLRSTALSCEFLSQKLKNSLRVFASILSADAQQDVLSAIKQGTQKQADIVKEGTQELKRIHRNLKSIERSSNEKTERKKDMKHLSTLFDE